MAKVIARVIVTSPDGDFVTLVPGDTVPEWATVTNPDALDSEESDADEPAPAKKAPARKAATS